MSDLFGTNCSSGAPQPVSYQATKDQVSETLKSLGADDTCIQAAENAMNEHSTSGQMSGSASVGFLANASFDAAFQTSGLSVEDSMYQEGCQRLFFNATQVVNNIQNIACAVNNTATETSETMTVNSSVSMVGDDSGYAEALRLHNARIANLTASSERLANVSEVLSLRMIDMIEQAQLSTPRRSSFRMVGGGIKVSATAKVKKVATTELSTNMDVTTNLEEIVQHTIDTQTEENLGRNGLSENVKDVAMQNFQSNKTDMMSNITNTAAKSQVEVNANGSITIKVAEEISLTDVFIDSSVEVNLAVSAMVSSAMDLGKELAMSAIAEVTNSSTRTTEVEGLSDIIDSLGNSKNTALDISGKNFNEQRKTNLEGGMGGILQLVAAAVVGLVALQIGSKMMSSTSSSSPRYRTRSRGRRGRGGKGALVKKAAFFTTGLLVRLLVIHFVRKLITLDTLNLLKLGTTRKRLQRAAGSLALFVLYCVVTSLLSKSSMGKGVAVIKTLTPFGLGWCFLTNWGLSV